jgi:hypothetical protein
MLRSTGLLFTFGCLVLPALAAKSLAREIRSLFWLAPVIAAGGVLAGLILAHSYDFPPGQVIVVVLTLLALGAGGIRQVRQRLLPPFCKPGNYASNFARTETTHRNLLFSCGGSMPRRVGLFKRRRGGIEPGNTILPSASSTTRTPPLG